jgi:hypothetical protein
MQDSLKSRYLTFHLVLQHANRTWLSSLSISPYFHVLYTIIIRWLIFQTWRNLRPAIALPTREQPDCTPPGVGNDALVQEEQPYAGAYTASILIFALWPSNSVDTNFGIVPIRSCVRIYSSYPFFWWRQS